VEACPPTAAYRFRKFARRNKVALLAAAAALATLLLLIVGLAVSNRMIAAERNEKARALALAEAQRARSDANFLKAIVAVRDIITRTALGRDNLPEPLRRKFSDQAIKFYESLLQDDSPDASLQYDTAVGYRSIGILHTSWGELEQAENCFRHAIDILDRLTNEYPAVQQYRNQLGYADLEYSRMLGQSGRSQEASSVVQRGIEIYEKLLKETPDSSDYADMLAQSRAEAWSGRAFSHFLRQQWDQAIADYSKAIELDPDLPNWLYRGKAHLHLAHWDKAAADFSKLLEHFPNDPVAWFFLAAAHAQLNQPSVALSDLHQAIANGFDDIELLKTYSLFDPIRSHPDFKKLVAELEEKKK